jgi:outer membrane protein OmpU
LEALGLNDQTSIGIGAAYNLGGGASISGGIAQIKSAGDENQGSGDEKETRADFGVKFSF